MTTATTGGSESSGGGQDGGETGMMFIQEPDAGGCLSDCDPFDQDCPKGEKCMSWAYDGGGSWNCTRCSPIDDNPGQPGDECTVEGSATSGIDSCDLGAMCWNVDPQTNMGTCVAMCTGDEYASICEDPDTQCAIDDGSYLVLCLPRCDPILQDCPEGEACYFWPWDTWNCAPDASGEGAAEGRTCLPWYEVGAVPPGYENVGFCMLA